MSQFLEAQRRFHANPSAPVGQYVRDIMQQYGDGGRRINLPQRSQQQFNDVLQYRNEEKRRYKNMENELAHVKKQLQEQCDLSNYFARGIQDMSQFLVVNQPDAPPGDRDSSVDPGGDSGAGVLHAEDRPDPGDTDIGSAKTIISGSEKKDGRPSARSNRSRRDGADERKPRETRFEDTEEPDAGRAQPDSTDAPEPDVDRQASEHGAEE